MKQKLIDILSEFGFPVVLKYSVAPKDYPKDIILIWNFDSSNTQFEDAEYATEWGFEVTYLSDNPLNVEKNQKLISKKLKDNGFVADGNGCDVITDISVSSHTGWRCDFYFTEVL